MTPTDTRAELLEEAEKAMRGVKPTGVYGTLERVADALRETLEELRQTRERLDKKHTAWLGVTADVRTLEGWHEREKQRANAAEAELERVRDVEWLCKSILDAGIAESNEPAVYLAADVLSRLTGKKNASELVVAALQDRSTEDDAPAELPAELAGQIRNDAEPMMDEIEGIERLLDVLQKRATSPSEPPTPDAPEEEER